MQTQKNKHYTNADVIQYIVLASNKLNAYHKSYLSETLGKYGCDIFTLKRSLLDQTDLDSFEELVSNSELVQNPSELSKSPIYTLKNQLNLISDLLQVYHDKYFLLT
jgi:hypothetical protein